jgi:hypothetical protein
MEKYRSAMERSAPEKFKKESKNDATLNKFYRQWRTFQVSDHLPLWVELRTDFADAYLASVMHGKKSALAVTTARREAEATSPVVTPPPIAHAPKKKARKAIAKKATARKTRKKIARKAA